MNDTWNGTYDLVVGQVVQLNPETTKNRAFAGCLLVVTELKSFGCQGYVQALGDNRNAEGGRAFYRPTWEEIDPLLAGAIAPWQIGYDDEKDEVTP